MSKESDDVEIDDVLILLNRLDSLRTLRCEYEIQMNAKSVIKEFWEDESCNGAFGGRLDYDIAIKSVERDMVECRKALREAEKREFWALE